MIAVTTEKPGTSDDNQQRVVSRKRGKLPKKEVEDRVRMIQRLMVEGWSFARIAEVCSQNWDVQQRQVWKYIKRAKDRNTETVFKNLVAFTEEDIVAFQAQQYNIAMRAVEKALAANDFKAVYEGLEASRKAIGRDGPAKFAHTTPDGQRDAQEARYEAILESMSPEALDAIAEVEIRLIEGEIDDGSGGVMEPIDTEYEYKDNLKGCIVPVRPDDEGI